MSSEKAEVTVENPPDYWEQTRQPLICLVFLAPLLAVYETGVFWLGGHNPEAIRNGADYWMRGWLHQVGFGATWLLPTLVVVALLVWQVFGKYPWRVSSDTLVGMFAESLLFAFLLIVIGQLQEFAFQRWGIPASLSVGPQAATRIVTYIGAGVYEEVMFRLGLLPACYGLFRISQIPVRWAAVLAILATSVTFSLAHYMGSESEQFLLFSFTFRALAGLFFAVLFVFRGFGITVGCHAAYDLLVGVLLENN